ncbi:MAG: alpha/beta hydrolase-fold protein [Mycobacterium sp.]
MTTYNSSAISISLLHGWLPVTVQLIAAAILVSALGRRSRRWSLRWLPIALLAGIGTALFLRWYVGYQGWSGHRAPWGLWIWIALTVVAGVVALAGWRNSRGWQRGGSVLAIPLCMLSAALAVNHWVGYVPTTTAAWDLLTGAPLGGQIDANAFRAMRDKGERPINGTVMAVRIPDDASGFAHRDELVYLPPAWYATKPPPALPVVMMIGGEFGHPADWPSVGAQKVLDDFATSHGGNAPVVVWVDQSGAFANDTECVNGVRGNAADHLTRDVVPYMVQNFGVSPDPAHWGIVGWSAGGTCALVLTVKYPELFSAFVDIDGQVGPNAGTRQQTLQRLFGGDAQAWAAFDPKTVMGEHGTYRGISAWFGVSEPATAVYRAGAANPGDVQVPPEPRPTANDELVAVAQYLCALSSSLGIECAVVPQPGKHDFPSAVNIFASALPWLAGKLKTPGVPVIPLPGAPAT